MKKGSQLWKGITELLSKGIQNSKWLVGHGNLNFWMDNWVGCGPLQELCSVVGSNQLLVAEVIDDRGPKLDLIRDLVSDEVLQLIRNSGVRLRYKTDVLIWKHSLGANFTIKSA